MSTICRVSPIFLVCFVVQLQVFLVFCGSVYISCLFGFYYYRCITCQYRECFIRSRSEGLGYFYVYQSLYPGVKDSVIVFFSMALIQTGAAYIRRGKIAPLQIVLNAPFLRTQYNFADFASACMSVVHFFEVDIRCSLVQFAVQYNSEVFYTVYLLQWTVFAVYGNVGFFSSFSSSDDHYF